MPCGLCRCSVDAVEDDDEDNETSSIPSDEEGKHTVFIFTLTTVLHLTIL